MSEQVYLDSTTADPKVKLPGYTHAEGCPQRRLETYTLERPADPQNMQPARMFRITRCIDCGRQTEKAL